MYDPVTLDQLRAFVAVVEEGSFSAAARKLKRVQSAISSSMSNLEAQLDVPLWDRTTKIAKLTPQGHAVLSAARRVLVEVDGLQKLTAGMHAGLEPAVSLCVDALFPVDALVELCARFAKEFPTVDLRVDTRVLSAVSAAVLSGSATIGVVGPPVNAPGLERKALPSIRLLAVAGPKHPLAKEKKRISTARLGEFVQIVLSELGEGDTPDQGVLSSRTWRVADLHTKHAMLRANLGWGNLPEHIAAEDVKKKRLVVIRPEALADEQQRVPFYAIYRSSAFGPAHRWILDHLQKR